MRLITFRHGDSTTLRLGAIEGDMVIDLQKAARMAGQPPPADMLDLIHHGNAAELADLGRRARGVPYDDVALAAPIPRPAENIICLGRNYAAHAAEMARARSEEATRPTYFTKAVTTVSGPSDPIPYDRAISTQLDWEVELAVVIGRRAEAVDESDALDHVFGYMVVNDISARDLQYGRGGQYFYGKSLNGSCPSGPAIVTADEVDPGRLGLRCRVNGEVKQDASTADMIFDVAAIIADLSRVMTLEPGQIIATGTPPGVGYAREPQEFLRPGDVLESEIDGIGVLRNRVEGV